MGVVALSALNFRQLNFKSPKCWRGLILFALYNATLVWGSDCHRPVTSSKMADFFFLQSFRCHFVLNNSHNLNYSSII